MVLTSRDKASGFDTRLGPVDSLVTIGGTDLKETDFSPEVRSIIHEGEVYINMRKPILNRVDKPQLVDGKIEALCDGDLHRYYTLNKDEMEWTISFASLPSSDEVRIEIDHSDNITFFKQIIPDELLLTGEGTYLRENVKGSWVAYINGKHGNKYGPGKVWSCSRPLLIDAKGNKIWCEIDIYPDGRGHSILIVKMPWEWLKRAFYPVLFDPVLGYNIVGGSSFQNGAATAWRGPYLASGGGEVVSIHIALVVTALSNVKMCLANCDQSGPNYSVAGKTIVAHATDSISTSSDDFSLGNLVIQESVVDGVYYKVGHVTDNPAISYRVKGDVLTSRTLNYYLRSYAAQWEEPIPAVIQAAQSIWPSQWTVFEAPSGASLLNYERGLGRGIGRGLHRGR